MDSEILKLMLGFFASGIGAALAGYLGVRFALSKIRRERAFDRRLEWIERMLRELHHTSTAIAMAMASENKSEEEQEEAWSKVWILGESLLPLSGEKDLYATPQAFAAIRGCMRDFQVVALTQAAYRIEQDTHVRRELKSMMVQCLISMRAAGYQLALEARSHLGLEPLTESQINADAFKLEDVMMGDTEGLVGAILQIDPDLLRAHASPDDNSTGEDADLDSIARLP